MLRADFLHQPGQLIALHHTGKGLNGGQVVRVGFDRLAVPGNRLLRVLLFAGKVAQSYQRSCFFRVLLVRPLKVAGRLLGVVQAAGQVSAGNQGSHAVRIGFKPGVQGVCCRLRIARQRLGLGCQDCGLQGLRGIRRNLTGLFDGIGEITGLSEVSRIAQTQVVVVWCQFQRLFQELAATLVIARSQACNAYQCQCLWIGVAALQVFQQ